MKNNKIKKLNKMNLNEVKESMDKLKFKGQTGSKHYKNLENRMFELERAK